MKTNKELIFDELVRLGDVKSEEGLNYLRNLTVRKLLELLISSDKK